MRVCRNFDTHSLFMCGCVGGVRCFSFLATLLAAILASAVIAVAFVLALLSITLFVRCCHLFVGNNRGGYGRVCDDDQRGIG